VRQRAAAFVFRRAVQIAPKHWRANLGLASAAMMEGDWDTASKSYWTARENAPGAYKQALSSAIAELHQIMNTNPGQ
jgi:Flp pilus assembly protein TadD